MTTTLEKNPLIIDLLNGTYSSIKNDCSDSSQDEKTKDIKSTFESSIWCSY